MGVVAESLIVGGSGHEDWVLSGNLGELFLIPSNGRWGWPKGTADTGVLGNGQLNVFLIDL